MGRSLRFGSRGGSCTAGGIESGCLRRDAFQLTSHPWPTANREWASTAGPSDLDRAPGAIRVKTHNSARLEAGIRVEARRSEHGTFKVRETIRLYEPFVANPATGRWGCGRLPKHPALGDS